MRGFGNETEMSLVRSVFRMIDGNILAIDMGDQEMASNCCYERLFNVGRMHWIERGYFMLSGNRDRCGYT